MGYARSDGYQPVVANPAGHSFSRGALYKLLSNPIYIGEIRHKGTSYPGQHPPIIERTAIGRERYRRFQLHYTPDGGGAESAPNGPPKGVDARPGAGK